MMTALLWCFHNTTLARKLRAKQNRFFQRRLGKNKEQNCVPTIWTTDPVSFQSQIRMEQSVFVLIEDLRENQDVFPEGR